MERGSNSHARGGLSINKADISDGTPSANLRDSGRQGGTFATLSHNEVSRSASVQSSGIKGCSAGVRLMLRLRSTRASIFGEADLFQDPAWDILLDLYAAALENRAVPVTSACIASMVPTTTALRWIKLLESRGLVASSDDDAHARRRNLSLTQRGRGAMESFMDAVEKGLQEVSVQGGRRN